MAITIDEARWRIIFDDRVFPCHSCEGTGLYSGFAEPRDSAVECKTCQGKGTVNYIPLPYSAKEERRPAPDHIKWVLSPMRMAEADPPRRRIPVQDWLKGEKP